MKLLLVDDEAGIRDGLAALLRHSGHEVRTAVDVQTGLGWLDVEDFDVVVTDWRLPDGDAGRLLQASPGPVVAVSGHPDDVTAAPNLRAVLQKPLLPADLMAVLQQVTAPAVEPEAGEPLGLGDLPQDAADFVRTALALLGQDAAELIDDGETLILRTPLPADDSVLDALAVLGGDLRILSPSGTATVELRLHRDGRPDGVPVVAAEGSWPAAGDFALDFDRAVPAPQAFLGLLDRVVTEHHQRTVWFLNIPPYLRLFAEVSGRGADLPKRTRVGPLLPAVLSDLWS